MKAVSIALFAGTFGCLPGHAVSAMDAVTYKEKVLYAFCGQQNCMDGANPSANLIDVNGTLYGTTYAGGGTGCGGAGCGTVFSIDLNTGTEKMLYFFCSQANCTDGALPEAGLINVNGTLYGTTYQGGIACSGRDFGCGTVFSLDPNTGIEKVLYAFCTQENCTDGANPFAGLIEVKGRLYGTTMYGGNFANGSGGVAFAFDPNSGAETVLYTFCSQANCFDGVNPVAGLTNVKGTLYGTTPAGGKGDGGTVFSLDAKTGAEKVLYSFCSRENCTDGGYPQADVVDVNGALYGTTPYGGANCQSNGGCGTVFALDPGTGAETVVYSFGSQQSAIDGANPYAGVVDVKGTLFGTTPYGGANCQSSGGCGTVFAVDPMTGGETVPYSFCSRKGCTDGANPAAGLIAVNHELYGTTENGEIAGCYGSGCGTLFVLKNKR